MSETNAGAGHTRGANLEAIAAATGHDWDDWRAWLDAHGAAEAPDHGALAALALSRMREPDAPAVSNPAWWAQSVSVAYEQQTGRRRPGQRADGTFDATATRTLPGEVADLHARVGEVFGAALAEGLEGVAPAAEPSTSETPKRRSWRVALADGSRLAVTVEPKAGGSTPRVLVAVTQSRIADGDVVADRKALWKQVLARL